MTIGSRGLVLLVDPKPTFRQQAEEAFAAAGFDVVTAANSMEAIYQLGGIDALDMLVTRASMPEGSPSGFGLAWIAKFGRPRLRVVLHTETDECLTSMEVANAPGKTFSRPAHARELVEAAGSDFHDAAFARSASADRPAPAPALR